jgi:hypothetical protein
MILIILLFFDDGLTIFQLDKQFSLCLLILSEFGLFLPDFGFPLIIDGVNFVAKGSQLIVELREFPFLEAER